MSINFVKVEGISEHVPEEHRKELEGTDWEETMFMTHDIPDTDLTDYEASEETGIFKRESDTSITKLDDFTRKLSLSSGIILEEKDFEVSVDVYFYRGEIKDIIFDKVEFVPREEREAAQQEFEDVMNRVVKDMDVMRKPPSLWSYLVSFIFGFIRYILGFFVSICWKIEKFLT